MIQAPPVLEPAPSTSGPNRASASKSEGESTQSPTRSKAESRMLRKLKRIEDGLHNKPKSQDPKLVNQVQEMLQKIEVEPQLLGGLVSGKKEQAKSAEKKRRRQISVDNNATWAKLRKESSKEEFAKVRKEARIKAAKIEFSPKRARSGPKEDMEEQIANERAAEETVDVGDEADWEHVQDEWTEEPELNEPPKAAKKDKLFNRTKATPKDSSEENDTKEKRPQEAWGIQKSALVQKFGATGWSPRKRLSPDTLSGIRALHASNPDIYSVEMLQEHFKITPEAIRRILKSKWRPSEEEVVDRMQRWEKRGVRKWREMSEQGQKPPKKWRAMGVPNPKLVDGKRKVWGSNDSGGLKEKDGPKGETEREIVQEEGLFGRARRMDRAQRSGGSSSLSGRIL